jgi:curli biogenesis system outer membrane secretion channel CsgG
MKKLALLVLVGAALLPSLAHAKKEEAPPAPPAAPTLKGGLRYSIGVTKFENRANYSGQFALTDTWGSILTDSLVQTGRFIVVGEADMRNAAMAEQDFAKSGRTAGGDKAPVTGNMTPAQLLVKGEITHFQASTTGGGGGVNIKGFRIGAGGDTAEINVVIYVVDSTTGQVVSSKKVIGTAKSGGLSVGFTDRDWSTDISGFKKTNVGKAVEMAIDQAVQFISSKVSDLPWTGNVLIVNGTKVIVNRGAREGVTAGQVFKVGSAEILRDPSTGETLDVSFTEKGQIKVDTVKEKISTCTITSGEGLEKGMSIALP